MPLDNEINNNLTRRKRRYMRQAPASTLKVINDKNRREKLINGKRKY